MAEELDDILQAARELDNLLKSASRTADGINVQGGGGSGQPSPGWNVGGESGGGSPGSTVQRIGIPALAVLAASRQQIPTPLEEALKANFAPRVFPQSPAKDPYLMQRIREAIRKTPHVDAMGMPTPGAIADIRQEYMGRFANARLAAQISQGLSTGYRFMQQPAFPAIAGAAGGFVDKMVVDYSHFPAMTGFEGPARETFAHAWKTKATQMGRLATKYGPIAFRAGGAVAGVAYAADQLYETGVRAEMGEMEIKHASEVSALESLRRTSANMAKQSQGRLGAGMTLGVAAGVVAGGPIGWIAAGASLAADKAIGIQNARQDAADMRMKLLQQASSRHLKPSYMRGGWDDVNDTLEKYSFRFLSLASITNSQMEKKLKAFELQNDSISQALERASAGIYESADQRHKGAKDLLLQAQKEAPSENMWLRPEALYAQMESQRLGRANFGRSLCSYVRDRSGD
jgi:hypothetical protein